MKAKRLSIYKTIVVSCVAILVLFGLYKVKVRYVDRYLHILEKREEVSSLSNRSMLKDGDIVFQTSLSSQSKAIQYATHSKFSHCGLLFYVDNRWYVYEAVQPVKKTPLDEWLARGENGNYVIKRLKNSEQKLTNEVLSSMLNRVTMYLGKDYDSYFEWSDKKIYCSELVWKVYNQSGINIAPLKTLQEFDLSHPLVKKTIRKRFGNTIPKNEPVVSPADIVDSPILYTVLEK